MPSLGIWTGSVKIILTILSDFSLDRETDTKKAEKFCKTLIFE
jgi:hypothetical protein